MIKFEKLKTTRKKNRKRFVLGTWIERRIKIGKPERMKFIKYNQEM